VWLDCSTGPANEESDPVLPAPTSSVAVATAMLDALALSLMRRSCGWFDDDEGEKRRARFRVYHPGGSLADILV
jgi:hypothetical protein